LGKNHVTITLLDEINCHIGGLSSADLKFLIRKTALPVAGAFTTFAYKQNLWDGKESLIDDEGFTFQYMLDQIFDIMEEVLLYDLTTIDILDERVQTSVGSIPVIDNGYLFKESGFLLRPFQEIIINKIIDGDRKGIINAATSSGKVWMCVGVSKAFDPFMKSVVVVPDENLAKQTYKDYLKTDLSVLLLTPKIKPDKREEAIQAHRHIILTSKLFMNCIEYFKKERYVLLLDEIHKVFGDAMIEILRFDVPHWEVRLGLTGTIPKDKLKQTRMFSIMGGGIIHKVTPRELQDQGYASTVGITMYITKDKEIESLFDEMYEVRGMDGVRGFDWSVEQDYLWTNINRVNTVADFIKTLPVTNTLVLCHPQFGEKLAPLISEYGCIRDEVPPETRTEWLSNFDTKKDHLQVASFSTTGTGLSYNHIYQIVLIDVGKTFSTILQSIGRGMRLDGETNHVNVVDISSDTIYSKRHRAERIKIYKSEKFDYTIEPKPIIVERYE
jgi:superfamily II DNA or RNA helicase